MSIAPQASFIKSEHLPIGWLYVQIAEIANTQTGGTPRRGNESFFGGKIPWAKSGELGDGLIAATEESLTEEGLNSSSARWCPPETVCIALYGATIGRVGIASIGLTTNQAVCSILPSPAHISRYLFYYLLSQREKFLAAGQGGAQSNISNSLVREHRLPLAPLAEQSRIADRLDELFSDLSAGVAALERVRKKLKRYRSAVLHAAVTGRLTAAWRKTHGPPAEPAEKLLARILTERRRQWEQRTLAKYEKDGRIPPKDWQARYSEPVKPKLDGMAQLPDGWCYGTLEQLADVTGGVAKNEKEAGGKGMRIVPYLRVANVQRGYLDLGEIKSISAKEQDIEELALKVGDVLFTEGGDRDKLGRGWVWKGEIPECIHQNHIFRARLVLKDFSPTILSFAGNSYGQIWFRENGKQSVNLASISLGVLRLFPVSIAPLAEQSAIVEAVNEKLSQIDAMEAEVDRGLARAARLRQSILKAAFEGKLVPQDPTDEPATKLLERIKALRREQNESRIPIAKRKSKELVNK